jgi:FkbH-like protein
MFELDQYQQRLWVGGLPAASKEYQPVTDLAGMSLLLWGEHCVECAAPACYQTCDLYQPRPDGRCRRFVFGAFKNTAFSSLRGYGVEVAFKKWAKLEALGNTRLVSVKSVIWHERLIGWMLPLCNLFGKFMNTVTRDKRWEQLSYILLEKLVRTLHHQSSLDAEPDSFLLEVYNPSSRVTRLNVTIRSAVNNSHNKVEFQKPTPSFLTTVDLPSGYSRHQFDKRLFQSITADRKPFQISLIPEAEEDVRLVFLTADFVKHSQKPVAKGDRPKVKCVVWDADNTLWQGVLVEGDEVTLRPGVAELLRYLDERGILLSIASKNDYETAWKKLTQLGIADYFLYPQINWNPKSQNIKAIASQLNIGSDTFAFIDDNPFELEEVGSALPEVECIHIKDLDSLRRHERLQGEVTADSRSRRRYYQEAIVREKVKEEYGADYFGFLASCNIQLEITSYRSDDADRVAELVQRTNQLNFSGRKYNRAELNEIVANDELEKFVLRCKDRYGSYGVVGFSIVRPDVENLLVQDFMLSCRVQGKFLEQAFFSHLLEHHNQNRSLGLRVNFLPTARNRPAQQVLESMGFHVNGSTQGDATSGICRVATEPLTCDFIRVSCLLQNEPDSSNRTFVSLKD